MLSIQAGYRLLVASAVFGVLGSVSVLASPPEDPSPEALSSEDCRLIGSLEGVWAAEEGDAAVRFQALDGATRYAAVHEGRLEMVAPIVACGDDFVEICHFGKRHRLEVALEGGRLDVTHRTTGVERTYRRVEQVPEAFEPRPLDLGEPGPLVADRVEAIREELVARGERDQTVREEPVAGEEMMRVDAENTARLKELVTEVGWIDPDRFGDEAADAAFLIVQHSGDLPLMLAALPYLRELGRLGEYALMYDRSQLSMGGEQRYGSQIGWTEGGIKGLLPIETLEGIDERRASLGLGSLDEYLALFGIDEPRVLRCGAEEVAAAPPSVDDLLRRAIEYHDPGDRFLGSPHRLSFRETRPDGEERDVEVEIDVPGERFLYRRRDGTEIVRIAHGGECEARVDGRAPSPAELGELRLDCERTLWLRDYYTFLWGLPMKLRDPGTRLGPLENDRFEGRSVWRLRVTWEEDVGGDVWYLYFDPASAALVGYRFYHDEAKGDGEVIALTGEVRAAGLRLPAERAWTTHLDDRYLGTDVLTEIEALEP